MAKKPAPIALSSTNKEVKKHVAAIHTSGELSLLERKMVNVLLLNAYDVLLTRRTHKIPVKHLCAMLGWDESNNTERLQEVLRKLASTSVEFNMMEDGKEVWRVMSMISYGEIKDGTCIYRYDEYLAERLYDPEIYATINIGIQRRFEGSYALTLYENCLRYKTVGSTGWWELERFRRIMGADAILYNDFRRLNERVIRPSIKEINKVSDIRLEAEFKREARKVSAVRFLIAENHQQKLLQPVIQDDHAAIRGSETFKRLLEHGIGERLAILWILQDEERARTVVEYVETRDRNQQVKGSTAGYIRSLYESDAVVGKSAYAEKKQQEDKAKAAEQKRKALEKRRAELKAEFVSELTTKAIHALSLDAKRALAREYMDEAGEDKAKTYNPGTAAFRDTLERFQFTAWMRKRLAPSVATAEFKAWLKDKGLSPREAPGA
jgi:hypothetical protein